MCAEDTAPPDDSGIGGDAMHAVALLARHPQWAVWLPVCGGEWVAARVDGSRPPGPGLPLLWAGAPTAEELGRAMRALDAQVSAGGWP